jgi:tRNA-dihydrouridine synthase
LQHRQKRGSKKETGCDGVMIGRGIFGNPWLFSDHSPSREEKLNALIEHTKLYEQLFSGIKSFEVMKRHFKAYAQGFDGAAELARRALRMQNR